MMPVIALHGIGADGRYFDRQAAALAPRSVVAVDMPGYGGTALEAYDFAGLAARVVAHIDPSSPAHLMGHSMGGMVAQEVAVRWPDLVASLILMNTTPAFGGRDPAFAEAFLSARLGPLDRGERMDDIAEGAIRETAGAEIGSQDLAALVAQMTEVPEAAYRAALACLVTFDRRAALANLEVPVLLLAGANDPAAPSKTMEKMAAHLPNARCHILPGGHFTAIEETDAVNKLISRFLANVERT